jgi:hypothetical protein
MLKLSSFKRSLGGQPREGVVHGPNPGRPRRRARRSPPTWEAIMGRALPSPHIGGPVGRPPNMGRGQVAALQAAPPTEGATSGRQEGGRGPRFGGCPTSS